MPEITAATDGQIYRLYVPAAADRFKKDILRVGRWSVNGGVWEVDAQTLQQIVAQFSLAKSRGVTVPVVWDHSESARDKIGEVLSLETDGQILWAAIAASDQDAAKRLSTVNDEVSVEIRENWRDGMGNVYPLMLTHVGVVNLPVVPGQQPFVRFSLDEGATAMAQTHNKTIRLQTDDDGESDGMIAVSEVADMLRKAGVPIPSEVKTVSELKVAVAALLGEEKPADSAPADAPPVMDMGAVNQMSLAALRRWAAGAVKQFAIQQKEAFDARLKSLLDSGKISQPIADGLRQAGEETRHSLSLLAPFDAVEPAPLKTTSRVRQLATGAPPKIGDGADRSQREEEARKRLFDGMGLPLRQQAASA